MRTRFVANIQYGVLACFVVALVPVLLLAADPPDNKAQLFREPPPEEVTVAIEEGLKYMRHMYPLDLASGERLVLAVAAYSSGRLRESSQLNSVDVSYLKSLTPDIDVQDAIPDQRIQDLALDVILSFELSALPYLTEKMLSPKADTGAKAATVADAIAVQTKLFRRWWPGERAFYVAVLWRQLYQADPRMRAEGIGRLTLHRVETAVPEIAKLLEDESEEVRIAAAIALRSFGKEDMIPPGMQDSIKDISGD